MFSLRTRIGRKLLWLTVFIALAMTLVVLLMAIAFDRIETLSADIARHGMAEVIENAATGRELSAIFSDIDALSRRCHGTEGLGETPGRLNTAIDDIARNIQDKALAEATASLALTTTRLLHECTRINNTLASLRNIDRLIQEELGKLEAMIGRAMIEKTLDGKSTEHLDQLMTLTTGYRETVLLIARKIAEQSLDHTHRPPRREDTLALLDDLALRLQTLTAPTPRIAQSGKRLIHWVNEYRGGATRFEAALLQLDEALDKSYGAKEAVLDNLNRLDESASGRVDRISTELQRTVKAAGQQLLGVSVLATLLTLLTVLWIIHRHINQPLRQVIHLIDAIRESREAITLTPFDRLQKDEWGNISAALLNMSAELRQHREHLEVLVQERTTALSIAKDMAEAANRSKSQFLANMSHEVRTPMNGILGMIELVIRRIADPVQKKQLLKAQLSAQNLLRIINDILDISKIEAERMKLEAVPFTLDDVLDNLNVLIGQKAQEKGLAFSVDIPAPLRVGGFIGDPLRLGQILLNLVSNAVKFTEKGGVFLRVHPQEDSATVVLLHFAVEDTGIGISPENQKRLFTAFEQADGSMTRKYGGTGLGLAISKRLVQMMGGSIGIKSAEGQGSTFWFTVRLEKAEETGLPATAVVKESAESLLRKQASGVRVLLAEDEPINLEVSRYLLEEVGFVVDIARDGLQALEMASQHRYALIMMDIQMPNMNGIDATQAIRHLPDGANVPILAMTANAYDEDRKVCLDAGMNDHISKPVDPDALFKTLLKWLG